MSDGGLAGLGVGVVPENFLGHYFTLPSVMIELREAIGKDRSNIIKF
jgi:hypothetical protein